MDLGYKIDCAKNKRFFFWCFLRAFSTQNLDVPSSSLLLLHFHHTLALHTHSLTAFPLAHAAHPLTHPLTGVVFCRHKPTSKLN